MTAHSSGSKPADPNAEPPVLKVLLIDDEDRFRTSLATRLEKRGFKVTEVGDPEDGLRAIRRERPDVIVLDRKMPKMSGEEVLREIKRIAPEVQVIMLTGHASMNSAAEMGRMDAFAYLEKPCETEGLVATIRAAGEEKLHAMARQEIPNVESKSVWGWLWGTHNFRPGILILGALLFTAICLMPNPKNLVTMLDTPRLEQRMGDPIAGYARYSQMKPGETVAEHYSKYAKQHKEVEKPDGTIEKRNLNAEEVGFRARVTVGILVIAALFWALGALPIGITAMLVGFLMYVFGVFTPDLVAKSYAKDAVIFIIGILAMSVGIAKSGLDRRIGLLLLGTSKSLPLFLFIFLPLLAVCASFLSEHALVAFIAPILMLVYRAAVKASGISKDPSLAVLFILALCFAANQGGPGSPAAGGRNAIMIGILADYGMAPSFGQWVMYGMPFVPVMALVIATYFYFFVYRKVTVKTVNVAAIVRAEAARQGPMTRDEYITAATLVLVIVLWVMGDEEGGGLGMGGPVLLGIVILSIARIITWPDVNKISWDVVALYASASAMGAGLAATGAATWVATSFVENLPSFMASGEGLAIASSLFTGVVTNFMSDGATVAALGPVSVPMAQLSGTPPWMVGFATAFASSFANVFIIGTPNNAIAYSLAKDMDTGEQLVTLKDFAKHGLVVTILSLLVLWGWAIFGYWQWIGFPS